MNHTQKKYQVHFVCGKLRFCQIIATDMQFSLHDQTRTYHILFVCIVACQNQCVKLTHCTQSDVADDDNDEDNTANHISAAPGGGKICVRRNKRGVTRERL